MMKNRYASLIKTCKICRQPQVVIAFQPGYAACIQCMAKPYNQLMTVRETDNQTTIGKVRQFCQDKAGQFWSFDDLLGELGATHTEQELRKNVHKLESAGDIKHYDLVGQKLYKTSVTKGSLESLARDYAPKLGWGFVAPANGRFA